MSDSLDDLRIRLSAFAQARNWGRFHSPKNLTAALAGEAGELVSVLQWREPTDALLERDRARLEDEMADVLIYLVRLADVCGTDLVEIANQKVDRNESRFPA
jgi:dCTP diphosphatase